MSSNMAVRLEGLSKCYHVYNQPQDRLKQFVLPRLARVCGFESRNYFSEFWAVRDVSLEIEKGETVGIIGRNGSGKSTLLQMICGTLNPTNGSVSVNGRIGALLELGSGFNPEFTGRENVYMNAAILGLAKEEIDERFDDIAAFSDIGQFMDQPVKMYSSGMVVRLAFAVQAQVEPDILIVDEALSVGDAKFQVKCFDRLRQLKDRGTSILLVTHSSDQIVTHCTRAMLLNDGVQLEVGEPRKIINRYLDLLFGKEKRTADVRGGDFLEHREGIEHLERQHGLSFCEETFSAHPSYNPHEYRWGDGAAEILDFFFSAGGQSYPAFVTSGQEAIMALSIRFNYEVVRPIIGVTIKTKEGVVVYGSNSEALECDDLSSLGRCGSVAVVESRFSCRLAPGDYFVSVGVASRQNGEVVPHDRRYDSIHFQVQHTNCFFGLVDLSMNMSACEIAS